MARKRNVQSQTCEHLDFFWFCGGPGLVLSRFLGVLWVILGLFQGGSGVVLGWVFLVLATFWGGSGIFWGGLDWSWEGCGPWVIVMWFLGFWDCSGVVLGCFLGGSFCNSQSSAGYSPTNTGDRSHTISISVSWCS